MHDLRGDEPHLIQGSISRLGIKKPQSGEWDDDLLCAVHEQSLQESDRYGVQWIRQFETGREPHIENDVFNVPNKRPDLLLKFVCSVVWRHAMSLRSSDFDMSLGPWEMKLRSLIFAESKYNPLFVISARRWLHMSEYIGDVAFMPRRNLGHGRRGWEFEIGGLVWILILDTRRHFRLLKGMAANDCNPVLVEKIPDRELVDSPGIIDIAVNMASRRNPIS